MSEYQPSHDPQSSCCLDLADAAVGTVGSELWWWTVIRYEHAHQVHRYKKADPEQESHRRNGSCATFGQPATGFQSLSRPIGSRAHPLGGISGSLIANRAGMESQIRADELRSMLPDAPCPARRITKDPVLCHSRKTPMKVLCRWRYQRRRSHDDGHLIPPWPEQAPLAVSE